MMSDMNSFPLMFKPLLNNNSADDVSSAKQKRKRKKNRHKKKVIHKTTLEEVETKIDTDFEFVLEKVELERWDPNYSYFSQIFDKFRLPDSSDDSNRNGQESKLKIKPLLLNVNDDDDDEEEPQQLSKRKLKEKLRISIANLKQSVQRPEVVEMHDANSKEPILLIHLKSYRNTVPVPKHWSYKRKYLQGKRGFVKPPFELPDYIKATGIMELRSAFHQKEDSKNLKSKMRNKIRPKLGRVDIDYQKLHDAFFKYQTKCRTTMHGDLYYEGKEFEVKLKQKKPGDISDDLRIALGMPVGMNKHLVPPPWLIAMQRYGPPPSYPNLKIPGLNAPIPEGATFGYHAGGWGKPPVDEMGRPLYGDVFGTNSDLEGIYNDDIEIDKSLWGELEQEESEDDLEEEMEDLTATNEAYETTGMLTPLDDGLITPSLPQSVQNVSTAIDLPQMIELRKRKATSDKPEESVIDSLYSIIPTKKSDNQSVLVGVSHTYDLDNKQGMNDEVMEESNMDIDMEIEEGETQEIPTKIKKSREKSSNDVTKSSREKKKEESKTSKKAKEFKF